MTNTKRCGAFTTIIPIVANIMKMFYTLIRAILQRTGKLEYILYTILFFALLPFLLPIALSNNLIVAQLIMGVGTLLAVLKPGQKADLPPPSS